MSNFHKYFVTMALGIGAVVLIHRNSSGSIVSSHADLLAGVNELATLDEDRPRISVINWTENIEFLPDVSDDYHELEMLERSSSTSLYTVKADPTKVVRYRQVCPSTSVDESLVNYWVLSYLDNVSVVPKVFGISHPTSGHIVWRPSEAGKIIKLRVCPGGEPAHIRYTIMERLAGVTVVELMRKTARIPVHEAALWTIGIVKAIQKIHKYNVIHGDVTWGNILINESGFSRIPSAKLVQLDHARIFSEEEVIAESSSACGQPIVAPYLDLAMTADASIWEAQGCVRSFRDDMFQILTVFGTLIFGRRYLAVHAFVSDIENASPKSKDSRRSAWVELKSDPERVFDINVAGYIFKITGNDTLNQNLAALAKLVLDMGITDRPDYTQMVRILETIVAVAQ